MLDAENRAWLDASVVRHLAMHGGDSKKRLAAFSTMESARTAVHEIAHADVQDSVQRLRPGGPIRSISLYSKEPQAAADPEATTSHHPTAAGRFRIVRPHAEGGLGKVSVAVDEELHREVALKEIKEHHGDTDRRPQAL